MGEYIKTEKSIIINSKENFNPKHILECGQIFRFFINDSGNYVVFSKDLRAEIEEVASGYIIIHTENPEYFEKFFNLDVDYTKLKTQITGLSPVLDTAIKEAYGLRILKGDLFEIIVSFIISANNNIKRIKLIIDRLCKSLGKDMGGYHAFPTVEEFIEDAEFFKSIGAGYRSRYLAEVKAAFKLLIKEDLDAMSDIELRRRLMKIKGVGPKVADCIMLFAFNRKKVFPVDVWMERVYYENFGTKKLSRPQISEFLTNKFGDLSGYVQQYMFYSKTAKIEN